MNQKGFANIILVVVIVILVGAVGYFAFVKTSEPVAQQPTPTQTKTSISNTPAPTTEKLFALWEGVALKLPVRAKINEKSVFIDNSEFRITGSPTGLCPGPSGREDLSNGVNCTYEDNSSLTNISVLRLWKDSRGV